MNSLQDQLLGIVTKYLMFGQLYLTINESELGLSVVRIQNQA